jgi:hypothetical protein
MSAASIAPIPFLIPVFGVLWGALFLHEHVSLGMLEGCAIVLAGTALATGVIRRVPGFSALARTAWRGVPQRGKPQFEGPAWLGSLLPCNPANGLGRLAQRPDECSAHPFGVAETGLPGDHCK